VFGDPRFSCSLGIGIAGRGWRIVSALSPKYVLFLGHDTLDGFDKGQVSLAIGNPL
jgi:hypothetical protein